MNQEIKKKWVDALRSGDYVQGVEALKRFEYHDTNEPSNDPAAGIYKHCCLGVLCELFLEDNPTEGSWGDYSKGIKTFISETQHEELEMQLAPDVNFLPPKVMKWAGLTDQEGTLGNNRDKLYIFNDSGMPFDSIADIIESSF